MARLRRQVPVPPRAAEPIPEHLGCCTVEDWVSASEAAQLSLETTINGVAPSSLDQALAAQFVARRRHRGALQAWLKKNPGADPPTFGRPVFRDLWSFVEGVERERA